MDSEGSLGEPCVNEGGEYVPSSQLLNGWRRQFVVIKLDNEQVDLILCADLPCLNN